MEMMPCQMCGRPPLHPATDFPYVECSNENCWVSGPRHRKNEGAIAIWNRMQSLIAKGLLLEDEAADSKNTKGRL